MPQHDYDIANGSGAAVRADLNNALAAIASTNKGPNAPPSPQAGMIWVEDDSPSSTRWAVRMYDGADWINLGVLDTTANRFEVASGATGLELLFAANGAAARAAIGARAAPEVVAEVTASSSATLDISGVLSDTYDRYELEIVSLVPASNDVSLALRVGTGGGPTWQAGASAYETNGALVTGSVGFLGGIGSGIFLSGAAGGTFGVGNQAGNSISGIVEFCNPEASLVPSFRFRTSYLRPTGNGGAAAHGAGYYGTTGAITGIRLLFSTGNIASGVVRLLGYRKV